MGDAAIHSLPLQVDIAIVGGGMVGISLALLLNQLQPQWQIAVIEKQSLQTQVDTVHSPSFDARSTALSWSSRQIFHSLNLWSAISSQAAAIDVIHVSDAGHAGLTTITADEASVPALGYVVENRHLGNVLINAIGRQSAIKVIAPDQVEATRPLKKGYSLTLESGVQMTVKLLVLADGADSQSARQLGIHAEKKLYGQTAIIANLGFSQSSQNIAYERFSQDGPMALLPLPDCDRLHRMALVWSVKQTEAEQWLQSSDQEFIEEVQRRFGYRNGVIVSVGDRASYPLALTQSSEQIRRNLVLVGNAAHSLHPVAGQGFNLSLRDVSSLAATLSAAHNKKLDWAELPVLQQYLNSQQQDQWQTVLFSDQLPRVFGMGSPSIALVRNLGLTAMNIAPLLRKQFAHFGMGLTTQKVPHGN